MNKIKLVALVSVAVLAVPLTVGAAGVTNFAGSGSGAVSNVRSGTSAPCDDSADCTETLSGSVNFDGATKGALSVTLMVTWSKPLSNLDGIVCAPADGTGMLGSLPVSISGTECETRAGSASKPHVLGGTIFAQGSTLTIAADTVVGDSGSGTGTYILGATGVFRKGR